MAGENEGQAPPLVDRLCKLLEIAGERVQRVLTPEGRLCLRVVESTEIGCVRIFWVPWEGSFDFTEDEAEREIQRWRAYPADQVRIVAEACEDSLDLRQRVVVLSWARLVQDISSIVDIDKDAKIYCTSIAADLPPALQREIRRQVEEELELTLAHQLNRSIGAIRSHTENLARLTKRLPASLERDKMLHSLSRVQQEIDFQDRLAKHTGSLHRSLELSQDSVDLCALLQEIKDQHFSRAPISLPSVARNAYASRAELKEALFCLIENAIHAVHKRDNPLIELRLSVDGPRLRLDVWDNGIGVPEGDRERIFEPRVTTKKGGADQPLGSGLGLPIARRFIEAMGGRLWLEPVEDGTCFSVWLVAAPEDSDGADPRLSG